MSKPKRILRTLKTSGARAGKVLKRSKKNTIDLNNLEKYSTKQYLQLAIRFIKLTFVSFWRQDRKISRVTAFVLALVILLSVFFQLYNSQEAVDAYDISGKYSRLLDRPINQYAGVLQYDEQSEAILFNEGYRPTNAELAGPNGSPKITARFGGNPERAVTVTDPVSSVSVTFKPDFPVRDPLRQDNRVIYPIIGQPAKKVYTLQGSGVKEDVIFSEAPQDGQVTLEYDIELSEGLEIRLEADGSLGVYGVQNSLLGNVATATEEDAALLEKARTSGEKTQFMFGIPAPVAIEQELKNISDNIETWFELDGTRLTVRATGMANANYPVSIDPSIYVETARKLMRGNNETNTDFDVNNELIQKSQTTGARIDEWSATTVMPSPQFGHAVDVAGGYVYSSGGEVSNTSTYTSAGTYSYVVPAGITSVDVKLWGGGGGGGGSGLNGGDGDGGDGGGGAYATSTLTVTPGETLTVIVGGGGAAGQFSSGSGGANSGDGGGGGGHSEIIRSSTPLIIAAGGGGGGGGDNSSATDGGDGAAGQDEVGGAVAGRGGSSSDADGGDGATSSAGGSGGGNGLNDGSSGSSEQGGAGADGRGSQGADGSMANGGSNGGGAGGRADEGANGVAGGGGGGGGYYGGGGGSASASGDAGGGGGGAGTSYLTGASTNATAGSGQTPGNSGDGDRNGAGDGGAGGVVSSGVGTAGDDGLILIEHSGGGVSTTDEVYWAEFNSSTGTIDAPNPGAGACSGWCNETVYNLPDGRIGHSMVAYNGFLYVMGGVDDAGTPARTNTVYIAKLGANGEPSLWHPTDTDPDNWVYWYTDSNLNGDTERSYFAATAYNNRMYILGGQTDASTGGTNTVEYANINPNGTLGTWTASAETLPSVRHGHSVEQYNGVLYLIGGNSNGTLQNSVHYAHLNSDGSVNAWQSTDSFSTARSSWGGSFSAIYGAYIYIGGGCSAVNGSGYCTTIAGDMQLASINADGSLDIWSSLGSITTDRIGYTYVGWQGGLYRFGGCAAQNTSTGACDATLNSVDYGTINPAGEVSTVNISVPGGTAPCNGGAPESCDLPGDGSDNPGDDAGEIGHMLNMSVILNGYLYVIGGCAEYQCNDGGNSPTNDNISSNTAHVAVDPDGTLVAPSSCAGTSDGAWCVNSTQTINGADGVAAAGVTVFNNRIYVVGGIDSAGGTTGELYYTGVNATTGEITGWTAQTLSSVGISENIFYTYVDARANPSQAGTYDGNLYVFGGCGTSGGGAGCSSDDYETEVYKCWIEDSGEIENTAGDSDYDCTTDGQLQLDTELEDESNEGLGIHSGTVYANYIYLIGGFSPGVDDRDTVFYARYDDSNNVVDPESGTANPADDDDDWIESESTLSVGRRRGWAFGYNGHIYAVGGYDSGGGGVGGLINFIEWAKINVSDGSIDTFVTSSVLINQRWGLSMAVSNSYAYVIGGCDLGASPSNCSSFEPAVQTFQLYNNDSGSVDNFTAQTDQTFTTDTDRWGASAVIHDGYLYVAGGCTSATDCTTVTDSVQYAPISAADGSIGTWAALDSLPEARAWGYLGLAGDDLYYVGGENPADTGDEEKDDVFYVTPVPGGGGSGTTIEHYSARRTTEQSKTSSGWSAVTGSADTGTASSTNGWVDSSNLTVGDDYLVMVWGSHNGNNGGDQSGMRVTHGGTVFDESQGVEVNDRTGAAYKTPYFWFTVWTAVSGEDIEVEYYNSSTNTGRVEDVTMVVMSAEDLVADGDLQYDIDIAGGTLDSTPTPKASLSWTPSNTNDSWWIMGYVKGDTVDTASDSLEYQLDIDSGTVRSAATMRGDTSADDTPVYGIGWVEPFSAAAHTVDLEISESSTDMEWDSAGVFALNLDRFDTFAEYSVAGDGATLTVDDTYVEQAGINPTPGTAGNVVVAAGGIADDDDYRVNGRLELSDTSITDVTGGWQVISADKVPMTFADMQINHPASEMDIDFDARFTKGSGPANIEDVWMVAFTTLQVAGDGVWATATNGLPGDRTRFGAAVWDDRIYVVGGLDDSANETATVYVSPDLSSGGDITSTWDTSTSFDIARQGAAVTAYANNLYVIGGYDGSEYLSDTQFASIGYKTGTISQTGTTVTGSGTAWTTSMENSVIQYEDGSTAIIQSVTNGTTMTVSADKTVAAGTVYVIQDGSVGNWTFSRQLQGSLRDGRAFAANGYVYVVGGRTADAVCNPKIVVAPISANTIIAEQPNPTVYGNNPTGFGEWFETNVRYTGDRYGAAVAYADGKFYTMGGGCTSPLSSNRHYESTVNSQPQVAQYSRMIDTDSDVFPNGFLLNGVDNSIGARWQTNYRSMHDLDGIVNPTEDCGTTETMPTMTTWGRDTAFGDTILGDVNPYTALNNSGGDINCARYFYFFISIDASQTFGYPEDVDRGPTLSDLSLFFTSDPNKRLRHGKSFTGGEQQPLDTPCRQSVDSDCPLP